MCIFHDMFFAPGGAKPLSQMHRNQSGRLINLQIRVGKWTSDLPILYESIYVAERVLAHSLLLRMERYYLKQK